MPSETFLADCGAFRKWIDKRIDTLKKCRQPHESVWQELRLHYEPSLGHALKGDDVDLSVEAAKRDDEKIINSTTRNYADRLKSGLQSGITNQAQQWFRLQPSSRMAENSAVVREYLDRATETLHSIVAGSNVYQTLDQIYLRLGVFGQACALLVPDDDLHVRLIPIDEGAYWIAENNQGRVDVLLRKITFTYSNLIDEFGERYLPEETVRYAKDGHDEQTCTVWNLIYPTRQHPIEDVPEDRPYTSVFLFDKAIGAGDTYNNHGIIDIRSYIYNPVIAPRWTRRYGSPYGLGPGEKGLGDAKELQLIERNILALVEQETNPTLLVDEALRGQPLDTRPGGVIYHNGDKDAKPISRAFETRENPQELRVEAEVIEKRLGDTFFINLFAILLQRQQRGRQMTATEVQEISTEKISLLGPILTQLNFDLLDPLVSGIWKIVFMEAIEKSETPEGDAMGLSDVPQELWNPNPQIESDILDLQTKVEYVSTLHIEQQSGTRLAGIYRLVEFVTPIAQINPEVLDCIDWDKMITIAGKSLVEHGCIRDDEEIAQLREQRAQAQAQQQAVEQQAVEAKSVKDLAGAKLTDGQSAMDLIARQGMGMEGLG